MQPVNDVYSWTEFQDDDIIVSLESDKPVELKILDARTKKPIHGARAFVEPDGMSPKSSGKKGRLTLENVQPMQWRMFAVAKGYNAKVLYPNFSIRRRADS